METVLIHRLGSFGDTIVALPCFHQIARSFPNARRIVVTNEPVSVKSPPLEQMLLNSGLIHGTASYSIGLRNLRSLHRLIQEVRTIGAKTLVYFPAPRSWMAMLRD